MPSPDRANLERLASVLQELDAELDGASDFDRGEIPDPLDPETVPASRILSVGGLRPPARPGVS